MSKRFYLWSKNYFKNMNYRTKKEATISDTYNAMLTWSVHCGSINSNESQIYPCVMEFMLCYWKHIFLWAFRNTFHLEQIFRIFYKKKKSIVHESFLHLGLLFYKIKSEYTCTRIVSSPCFVILQNKVRIYLYMNRFFTVLCYSTK